MIGECLAQIQAAYRAAWAIDYDWYVTSYARFDLPDALESVFYGLAQDVSEQQQNGS